MINPSLGIEHGMNGKLIGIFTSPNSGLPMIGHSHVRAIAHAGLEGDRYANQSGHYSGVKVWDAHVTLIQSESFVGSDIVPEDLRRNLLTEKMDLNDLVGRPFQIGESVVLYGRKAWPPCFHIARQLHRKHVMKHFSDRGGIGADILKGGLIQVGDSISVLNHEALDGHHA